MRRSFLIGAATMLVLGATTWLAWPRIDLFRAERRVAKQRQTLDRLVSKIASVNELHFRHIGIGFEYSDQFERYEKLSSSSTTKELLDLTKHPNLVVRCYAGWGLIDKKYEGVKSLFREFLQEKQEIIVYKVCFKDRDAISSVLYHKYWNSVADSMKESDSLLFSLDETILNNEPKADWLLIRRALDNRKYPEEFKPKIEHLAFEELNKDAIFYLLKWYPDQYRPEVRKSLIAYISRTTFREVGVDVYLEVAKKLLAYGDEEAREAVLSKMKSDRHWRYEREGFASLLKDRGIDVSAVEAGVEQHNRNREAEGGAKE